MVSPSPLSVKTVAEFVSHAERVRNIIGQLRGAARAKEFWAATSLGLSGGLRNVD